MPENRDKRVFISYSSKDRPFVRKLVRDLVAGGIAVWVDEEQIMPGDSITEKLANGLGSSTDLLIVLSEHFLNSRWCKTELRTVLHKQITARCKQILPLQISSLPDACWNDFPLIFLEDIVRIDMSGRNYKRGLASLLGALGGIITVRDRDQPLRSGPQPCEPANSSLGAGISTSQILAPSGHDHGESLRDGVPDTIRDSTTDSELDRASRTPILNKDKEYGTRFVEVELPLIIRRAVKEGIVPTVVFIDVDNLTVINKVYGWEVGNVVLDVVYEAVRRRSFAKAKYKGRCGDDTFYSVLFDSARAEKYCMKLRDDVYQYPWRRISPKLRVSCTIGYATFKANEHPYEWLARAILGMLEGKKEGPNTLQVGPQFSGQRFKEAPIKPEPPHPLLPTSYQRLVYHSDPSNPPVPPTFVSIPQFSLRDFFS